MKVFQKCILLIISALFCAALILDRDTFSVCFQSGFETVKAVIPTLFPFLIISKIMCACIDGAVLKDPAAKLLGLKNGASFLFAAGNICGFPVGAAASAEMYENDADKKGGARCAVLTNNVSLSFALCFVGRALLGDIRKGAVLWLIQLVSAIIICFADRLICGKDSIGEEYAAKGESFSFSHLFCKSVTDSAIGAVSISAYICFFSLVSGYLSKMLCSIGLNKLSALSLVVFEISSGCRTALTFPYPFSLLSLSFVLGFSGLCVICQSVSYLEKSSVPTLRFFIMKIIQGVLAALISLLVLGKDFVAEAKQTSCRFFTVKPAFPVLCIAVIAFYIIFHIKEMCRTT